jgi:glycosyltransferase involved in cell wall biosynthesis
MPRHFCIWIVSPPGYMHSRCFEEVALSLKQAFATLGFNAPIVTDPKKIKDWGIVLGANLLSSVPPPLPPRLILYNLEQIQKDSPWLNAGYIELLRKYPVWDYSERNLAGLRACGITRAALCGVGYMPGLTRITPALQKDIDVLFVGSTNERRVKVLGEIAAGGAKVLPAYNSYGPERDALIARAKLVLNVHYYEAQVFEIVRVSYLLANRICVVSENGQDDKLEAPLKGGLVFAPYAELAAACLRLLKDENERLLMAQAGFERFSALSQVPMLKAALKATLPEVFGG